MFWSFEITQLLARDRISQMQRDAERDRLARLAAARPSGDIPSTGLRSGAVRAEEIRPLWPRDRHTLGLARFLPWRTVLLRAPLRQDGREDNGPCGESTP
jgi:hypothetical protein